MAKVKEVNSYIVYEGISNYDGEAIVVIATGFANKSKNTKTGDMIQTWIMRQDTPPHEAIRNGNDYSICGNCPLRPLNYKANGLKKRCYVLVHNAPLTVWRTYKKGGYEHSTPERLRELLQDSNGLRLGSYGDPASVPFEVWQSIGVGTGEFNHTGYTHGYLVDNFDTRYLDVAMISLDKVTPQIPPGLNGRSFRVIDSVDEVLPGEILCPASKEQNYKTTCEKCGLCAGLNRKAKNIAIIIH